MVEYHRRRGTRPSPGYADGGTNTRRHQTLRAAPDRRCGPDCGVAAGDGPDGQLKAIVGVEVIIDRVEGKLKLSQNRSDADMAGVIEGPESLEERAVSVEMRRRRR
jgi:predicted FMN-binding regulatory protein PaiB